MNGLQPRLRWLVAGVLVLGLTALVLVQWNSRWTGPVVNWVALDPLNWPAVVNKHVYWRLLMRRVDEQSHSIMLAYIETDKVPDRHPRPWKEGEVEKTLDFLQSVSPTNGIYLIDARTSSVRQISEVEWNRSSLPVALMGNIPPILPYTESPFRKKEGVIGIADEPVASTLRGRAAAGPIRSPDGRYVAVVTTGGRGRKSFGGFVVGGGRTTFSGPWYVDLFRIDGTHIPPTIRLQDPPERSSLSIVGWSRDNRTVVVSEDMDTRRFWVVDFPLPSHVTDPYK